MATEALAPTRFKAGLVDLNLWCQVKSLQRTLGNLFEFKVQ